MKNQVEKILPIILDSSYTREEASACIELLTQVFEKNLYNQNNTSVGNFINTYIANNSITQNEREFLSKLIEFEIDISSTELYSFTQSLNQEIEQIPILIIHTPIELERSDLKTIALWVKEHVGKNVLLSTPYSPRYKGGCALSWNGNLKQYNFFPDEHTLSTLLSHELSL